MGRYSRQSFVLEPILTRNQLHSPVGVRGCIAHKCCFGLARWQSHLLGLGLPARQVDARGPLTHERIPPELQLAALQGPGHQLACAHACRNTVVKPLHVVKQQPSVLGLDAAVVEKPAFFKFLRVVQVLNLRKLQSATIPQMNRRVDVHANRVIQHGILGRHIVVVDRGQLESDFVLIRSMAFDSPRHPFRRLGQIPEKWLDGPCFITPLVVDPFGQAIQIPVVTHAGCPPP